MKKEEYIKKYGEEMYEKLEKQRIEWRKTHPSQVQVFNEKNNRERNRKGGKYYEKARQSQMKGLPHEKTIVRQKHQRIWTAYKQLIAPESQIHHEWIPETANFRGVALVEADQHLHGFIDVIQILEGEITLLTEAEIRGV